MHKSNNVLFLMSVTNGFLFLFPVVVIAVVLLPSTSTISLFRFLVLFY